jgi:NAD(P)-dependent dehydrogenase (short-subunit alcohol dehydrogenase family)
MLAVTGLRSRIVTELRTLLPADETVVRIGDNALPPICERYVLAAGLLYPKPAAELTDREAADTALVNWLRPVELCEHILLVHPKARIVAIGSESAFTGSHNMAYASAKAGLHEYVETKKLKPEQQLICVAPSIIADTSMTERRTDLVNLEQRRLAHPKKRFLRAIEVARLVHYLLYIDEGYLSNTVIRMNGGGR